MGCRNVRCPSNTFAMNAPSGLVQSRINPKKSAICKIPMLFIIPLEFLRTQQGVDQVNEQAQRCDTGNGIVHEILLELVACLCEHPKKKQRYATYGDKK